MLLLCCRVDTRTLVTATQPGGGVVQDIEAFWATFRLAVGGILLRLLSLSAIALSATSRLAEPASTSHRVLKLIRWESWRSQRLETASALAGRFEAAVVHP